jgi:glycerol kinase
MKKQYIISITQNKQTSEAFILDKKATLVGYGKQDVTPISSTEIDALEIIYAIRSAVHKSLTSNHINPEDITAIAISTTGNTIVSWEKHSGLPLHPVKVHKDKTLDPLFQNAIKNQISQTLLEITGQSLTTESTPLLLKWHIDQSEAMQNQLKKKNLMIGTLDTWIVYNLTGRTSHLTDRTHAASTQLFNMKTLTWDDFLCKEFSISGAILPTIIPSQAEFGKTQGFLPLPDNIPIVSICEKRSASLLGTNGFNYKDTLLNYEKNGHFLLNNGTTLPNKNHFTLLANGHIPHFGITANIPFPNCDIPWLPTMTDITENLPEAPSNNPANIFIIPIPEKITSHTKEKSKIAILGLSSDTTLEQLKQAYLEAIAFQCHTMIRHIESTQNLFLKEVKAIGPLAQNDHLLQLQANTLQLPVVRMATPNPQAIGAAILAGLATGFFKDKPTLQKSLKIEKTFLPTIDPITGLSRLNTWLEYRGKC